MAEVREKKFHCQLCTFSAVSSSPLIIHMDTVHKKMKAFECEKHIRTVHENEKPYKCESCHTCFGRNYSLKLHKEAVHENKKPFSSEIF